MPQNIYLYREAVDFRKSIYGLAAIIESKTNLSLSSGSMFLFDDNSRDADTSAILYSIIKQLRRMTLASTSTWLIA